MKKLLFIFTLTPLLFSCAEEKYYTTTENELKLNIEPMETEKAEFDFPETTSESFHYIYIGRLKESVKTSEKDEYGYYLQLNDAVKNTGALKTWLICDDCDMKNEKIAIIADKNTPKNLLSKVESIIQGEGYLFSNVYYYEKNKGTGVAGYNSNTNRKSNAQQNENVDFTVHFNEDTCESDTLIFEAYSWLHQDTVPIALVQFSDSVSIPIPMIHSKDYDPKKRVKIANPMSSSFRIKYKNGTSTISLPNMNTGKYSFVHLTEFEDGKISITFNCEPLLMD